ncbi:ParB N-terminal domain-containing protein [Streptomyces sp. enrichment culture]|uniref:ParB N-terminal domain-containing protein n=1 Tax=Streptomyces sp. enrichment culture TaxID=1795815 RepID=UPI003F553C29
MKVEIKTGDPRSLKLLELNARYMRHEQYQQLVNNLRRDEALTSTPFVWHDVTTGDRIVLSGNHRTKASIEAGIEEITWLETSDPLTESQRLAIQISHNSIAGEDDLSILKTLYEKIDDLDLRQYAGIDDATLELLADLDSPSLGEANLSFQTLAIVFLPDDLKEAQDVLRDALALASSSDAVWVAALRQYDQTMAALDLASKSHDVTNVATAFGLILESFKDHASELVDGWYDRDTGEPKHHGMAPLLTLFHTDAVPTKAAAVVEKALQQAVARGDVPAEHRYKALEQWAQTYLDTPA